ncbi:glycosyltransferase family 2 protein [Methylomonas sp. AM2-LC]|uniref:glycosyltransferase family 2 protein n=1 Tax=Methylomonas sp. AM2-LC TaxID=3153301 RepID=UPI0032640429
MPSSLVVYKPDLVMLEEVILSLQKAALTAKQHYTISFSLTIVDNSNEECWQKQLQIQYAQYQKCAPDWTLELLHSADNMGYGAGNNKVIREVKSDYHLVINPDLFIEQDMLLQCIRFMEANPNIGLLVPAVFGENGDRHYLCKRNPTLCIMFIRSLPFKWIKTLFQSTLAKFEMRDCNYEQIIENVEFPSGCCMFFRTKPLQQIQGFDPDYFLYYEDADIGRRMRKIAGVVYLPNARAIHRWARATHRSKKFFLITIKSGLIYWYKWNKPCYPNDK